MKSSVKLSIAFVVIVSVIASLVFYSAQPTTAIPLYEKNMLDDKTIRIQTSKGPVADIQLIENTEQCLVDCYAILKFHTYTSITLPSSPDSDFSWDFIKAKPDMRGLRSYHFEKLESIPYTVTVPIYENQSYSCTVHDNETGTDEAQTCWNMVQTNATEEIRYKEEYKPFDFWGKTIDAGDTYIKVVGEKYPTIGGENNIDWIFTIYGLEMNEWTWWNNSWMYRKPITINVSDGSTLTNFQVAISINTSQLYNEGKLRSDCGDIRFLNNGSDYATELDYWNMTNCNITGGNTTFWVETDKINTTIYMYYKNSGATSKSNCDNTFLFCEYFDDLNLGDLNSQGGWTGSTNYDVVNDQYISQPYSAVINVTSSEITHALSGNLTYARAWFSVRMDSTTSPQHYFCLDDSSYSSADGYCIMTGSSLAFQSGYSGSWSTLDIPTSQSANTWYDLEVRYDYANKKFVKIFVNGVEKSSDDIGFPNGDSFDKMVLLTGGGTDGQRKWIDNIRYAKYSLTEPTYSIGLEDNQMMDEAGGRVGIEDGIKNSVIGNSAYTLYGDQQIYERNISNGQMQGRFDKVVVLGNQTWAFNYIAPNDNLNPKTYMVNITPVLYVWEYANISYSAISGNVSALINSTKQ